MSFRPLRPWVAALALCISSNCGADTPPERGAEAPPAASNHDTATSSDRVAGWNGDLDVFLAELKRQHYVYQNKPLPAELTAGADRLRREIPHYSDARMLAELQRLATWAGDGHTYVLPFGAERVPSRWLPLRFYLFSDGLFVIDAT